MPLWPTTIESLAKYEAAMLAVVVFAFNFRQSSIKRKGDYNLALTNWANAAIEQLLVLKFSESKDRPEVMLKLRTTIDQGRLFFPNKKVAGSAHGWRPRLLDWLTYSEKLMDITETALDEEGLSKRHELLEGLRRGFIEDTQLILAPTSFLQIAPILRLQIMIWRRNGSMDTSQSVQPIPATQAFLERFESRANDNRLRLRLTEQGE
jgi:hypothetical protein